MRDAVLVASMDRAQDVRLAVEALKAESAAQAEDYPRFHRPWGWYETLTLAPRYQVKRIMVRPGGKLSLQSHAHRAEHWVVVAGTALVTLGEQVTELGPDPVLLRTIGRAPSAGESGQSGPVPDRGPKWRLSGRGRYHPL